MRTFKQLILLFTISLFVYSCNTNERSVGMNTWDGVEDLKFYLGTEDPINTVMEFDNADRAKDYEKMRSMTTDTTTFIGGNGIVKSVDEFFDQKSERALKKQYHRCFFRTQVFKLKKPHDMVSFFLPDSPSSEM